MNSKIAIKKSHTIFGLLFGIYFFFSWSYLELRKEDGYKNILKSDGLGYYSYLPKIFLDGNLTYEEKDNSFASVNQQGKYINRFYVGTAILEAPFFLLGYGIALITGHELDGYSFPFAFMILLAAIFYALAGFYIVYKILSKYFLLKENQALITVLIFALGSNLFYYVTIQGSFSHVFSFFTISLFIWQTFKTIELTNSRNLFISALLFSLIIMIRPVNGILILLTPFFFEDSRKFISYINTIIDPRKLLYILLGLIIPFLFQSVTWYLQTGNWIEWPYQQEGFNFSQPHFFDILFGFRRGLFIYCPLLLFSLLGIYWSWRNNLWKTIWLLITLLFFIYVTASWWHWTYGDTFGMRPFNDILFIFVLFFANIIKNASKLLLRISLVFSLLFIYMNQIYAYQFNEGIINYSNMDRTKFFSVFMKTSKGFKNIFGGANDIPPFAPNGFETIHHFNNNFESETDKYLVISENEFPAGTEFIFPEEKNKIRHAWIQVNLKRKLLSEEGMKNALFIIQTIDPITNTTKKYYSIRMKEYPEENANEWESISMNIWLPDTFKPNEIIKLYIWNKEKETFYIDDLSINVQLPKW